MANGVDPDQTAPLANSVDPDQTAPIGAVCSGSALFASILKKKKMHLKMLSAEVVCCK